jgi:ABC-type Fe3+/spermidine/putrescine transport system ATPase subunit
VIELASLHLALGEFALRDLSLRIGQGEYWVILGPSGCGKSVLMQTIAGFFSPERGRISVGGRDVTALPPERRRMGLVFQQAALFPHKSVWGNIAYGLRARGARPDEIDRTVSELVARLGLTPILERPVATLSGGEAQRVAVARALAIRPDLLLLDEPMSALDHNTRLELQVELAHLHRELGLTTVHVTPSREEAAALGDHVAIMLGGRIVQQGPSAEVTARPRCPFVARFLGLELSAIAAPPPCAARCGEKPGTCTAPESR